MYNFTMTKLCLLMLCMQLGIVTGRVICMNKEIGARMLKLNCTVDKFTSDINIHFSSKDLGYAYCIVPVSSETNCSCSCNSTTTCNCSISMDLSTRTTTLQIFDSDLSSLFGCYTCAHGSYKKSMMISRSPTKDCADDEKHDETPTKIGLVLSLTVTVIAVATLICICCFPYIPGRILNMILRCIGKIKDTADYTQLQDNDCTSCAGLITCAVCVDCRAFFCDACGEHHIKNNLAHIVLQTRHIAANQKQLICNTCRRIADRYCTLCWSSVCTSCSIMRHTCGDKDIIIITDAHSEIKRQKYGEVTELRHLYRISLHDDDIPVRVCGIAYLEGDTVVVIDGNNRKLIVFKSNKAQMKEQLKPEHGDPNAMTAIAGNDFAVTYPERRYIQIYKLTLNTNNYKLSEGKKIDTLGKPFNIAYNHYKFAVEIGEGDDGRIIILDIEKEDILKKIKCQFAFFTGHTIRLALDKDHIFVSAMGKKMVSCLDYDGKEKWHQSIPGPRTIIVPEDKFWGKKLILSSRRCNAIYEMKKEKGNYEIVKATGKISSPRYMAYQSDTKTLCILVENDISHKDELEFFSVKCPEITDSISEPGDIELQGLLTPDNMLP